MHTQLIFYCDRNLKLSAIFEELRVPDTKSIEMWQKIWLNEWDEDLSKFIVGHLNNCYHTSIITCCHIITISKITTDS